MKTKRVRWAGWLPLLLATSCATTHAVRHVKTSGFLGDYSQLQPGGDGEPALIYRQAAAGPGYAKLLTAAGFQLKGSGWYATDFSGKKSTTESSSATASTSESKPASAPDAAPAAAPAPATPAASTTPAA